MIYLLLFVYMLAFPIMLIVLLMKILDKLENKQEIAQTETNVVKRKMHPSIGTVNYKSQLEGRKSVIAYEKYKNKEGLYEPVKPTNGIPIKKEE